MSGGGRVSTLYSEAHEKTMEMFFKCYMNADGMDIFMQVKFENFHDLYRSVKELVRLRFGQTRSNLV